MKNSILLLIIGIMFSVTTLASELIEVPMIYTPTLDTPPIMSNGFNPHRGFQGTNFRLEPLHRNHSPLDYQAWHDESWEDLRVLYGRAWNWPREISESQNAEDLERLHYKQFLALSWISYAILNTKGDRVIGSLYITPQSCGNYGAVAMYWITTPVREKVEKNFHSETLGWLQSVWPWNSVYHPGPSLSDEQRGNAYYWAERGLCL